MNAFGRHAARQEDPWIFQPFQILGRRCSEERMPVRLIESLSTTEPLTEVFFDRSVLRAMLDFEVGWP